MKDIVSSSDLIKRMEWEHEDKEKLLKIWVNEAVNAPLKQAGSYFQMLVQQTPLTQNFKAEMIDPFNGHAVSDAQTLFNWARGKGINPANPKYTTLGSVIYPTLFQLGVDEAHVVAALIVKYRLIVDTEERRQFAVRFQIPTVEMPPTDQDGPTIQFSSGPDFSWSGSEEEMELQGLFRSDPIDLDIGFLDRAIAASSGVCRIEIENKAVGTGFLISPDHVVTNYHVLGSSDTEVETAAARVMLRFGAMTNQQAQEEEGQLVAVSVTDPILLKSQVAEHDFVVLKADQSIYSCMGLKPLALRKTKPNKSSNINIIHHSSGNAMRLQFSPLGISSIIEPQGKLQYVSRTKGGSSGSPCFDDDFNVIAIHHAARSTVWGVAGEGILISAIHELIKQHLDGGNYE